MRIELKQGAVQLGQNQTLRVVDGAGSTRYHSREVCSGDSVHSTVSAVPLPHVS